jgi:hemolysin activation/secretion protein
VSSAKTLGFSLEKKNYESATSGTVFSESEIYNLSASLSGLNRRPNLSFKWNVTASVGDLRLLNDNQATLDASGASTAGSFGKATFSASASMPVRLIDDRTALTASVSGQLASKNLNSAEQFYLGGPYAIRAYPVAQGAGSQGLIASLSLSRQFGQSLSVGLFADAGVIQQYVSTWGTASDPDAWRGLTRAGNVYELYAGGITAAYVYKGLQLDATFAHRIGDNPLYNTAGKQLNVDNRYLRDQVWVRATLSF